MALTIDLTRTDLESLRLTYVWCENGYAKWLRERAGFTQAMMSAHVGTTRATVSRWESGTRKPGGDAAVRYARVLHGLHLDYGAME